MSYTVADVDRVMETIAPEDYYGSGWPLFKWQEIDDVPTDLGVISHVADHGGEGQGDEYWVVVKITGHDGTERFFRKDGWYQSYSGGELDGDTYEVKPAERVATFYE